MPLVSVRNVVYVIGYSDRLVAIKGAMLTISGAVKPVKFGNRTARVRGQIIIVFCGKHGVTSLSDE